MKLVVSAESDNPEFGFEAEQQHSTAGLAGICTDLLTENVYYYCISIEIHGLCSSLAEFRQLFALHDSDSDGQIPFGEVASMLKGIGVSVTDGDVLRATADNADSCKLCQHANH